MNANATLKSAPDAGLGAFTKEFQLRTGSGRVGGTLAVAQVIRDGMFSNVSILMTKLIGAERESLARALVTGC